eukprot:snap_masked-scaffold_28-processed-gene-4.83-mRNA-1 protein AED:1.00 eAED:1.00 QI:0/-1/0/0/-1/1/1/0/69
MKENHKWDINSVGLDRIKSLQKLPDELNYLIIISIPKISSSVNRIGRKLHDGIKEICIRTKSTLFTFAI